MIDLAVKKCEAIRPDNAVEVQQVEQEFGKEQILASARYANRRDLVDALLENGKKYTTKDIDKKIEEFMKGTVK